MATLTSFFTLVGSTFKSDFLAICRYIKSIYNHGDVDYAAAVTLLVFVSLSVFLFVAFPRTVIVSSIVIWRMYAHVIEEDDEDDG